MEKKKAQDPKSDDLSDMDSLVLDIGGVEKLLKSADGEGNGDGDFQNESPPGELEKESGHTGYKRKRDRDDDKQKEDDQDDIPKPKKRKLEEEKKPFEKEEIDAKKVSGGNVEEPEKQSLFGSEIDSAIPEKDEFSQFEEKSKKIVEKRREDQEAADAELKESFVPTSSTDKVDFQVFGTMSEKDKQESKIEKEKRDVMVDDGEDEEEQIREHQTKLLPPPLVQERMEEIQARIVRIVKVLMSFKELKEEGYSRKDYLKQLKEDLCIYYRYNEELLERFFGFFSIPEVVEFLEASQTKRPVTIRINTLKITRKQVAQSLLARGIDVDGLEGKWTKNALKINPTGSRGGRLNIPIGATPEYLAGYYILQNPSSLLPVLALQPYHIPQALMGIHDDHLETFEEEEEVAPPKKEEEDENSKKKKKKVKKRRKKKKSGRKYDKTKDLIVLDMCAAPGTKTTHLAEMMKNSGVLYANDVSKKRLRGLISNVHRMGVTNCVVMNIDGRDLPAILQKNSVHKILLDAPCSGTGVISKDPSIKQNRREKDLFENSRRQKELIIAAMDCLKVHGEMIYSTCSVLPQENEEVVDYVLKKRLCKVVPIPLKYVPFGMNGLVSIRGKRFHPSLKFAKRFYPHLHNMDGFFVCKIVKTSNGPRDPLERQRQNQFLKRKMKRKNEQKLKRIEDQMGREQRNKELYEAALEKAGGDHELARKMMKDRRENIKMERKMFKTKKKKKKWRKTQK